MLTSLKNHAENTLFWIRIIALSVLGLIMKYIAACFYAVIWMFIISFFWKFNLEGQAYWDKVFLFAGIYTALSWWAGS